VFFFINEYTLYTYLTVSQKSVDSIHKIGTQGGYVCVFGLSTNKSLGSRFHFLKDTILRFPPDSGDVQCSTVILHLITSQFNVSNRLKAGHQGWYMSLYVSHNIIVNML